MPAPTQRKRIYDADRVDARNALVAALESPDAYNLGRVRIRNLRTPGTLDALLELLNDVTHEDWHGLESGQPYRSYFGRLASGLPVEVLVNLEREDAVVMPV